MSNGKPNPILSELYHDVERNLSCALQPERSRSSMNQLVTEAINNLRKIMTKMGLGTTVLMQVHLVIHIHGGILQEVRGFLDESKANACEQEFCKNLKIPFDPVEREKYYDKNESNDDILREDIDVDIDVNNPPFSMG